MALLRHPPRAPDYRGGRPHGEFVVRLREVCGSRRGVVDALCRGLKDKGFAVVEAGVDEAEEAAAAGGLRGTRLLRPEEYLPAAAAAAAAL